jgi:hypothetical protein
VRKFPQRLAKVPYFTICGTEISSCKLGSTTPATAGDDVGVRDKRRIPVSVCEGPPRSASGELHRAAPAGWSAVQAEQLDPGLASDWTLPQKRGSQTRPCHANLYLHYLQ